MEITSNNQTGVSHYWLLVVCTVGRRGKKVHEQILARSYGENRFVKLRASCIFACIAARNPTGRSLVNVVLEVGKLSLVSSPFLGPFPQPSKEAC